VVLFIGVSTTGLNLGASVLPYIATVGWVQGGGGPKTLIILCGERRSDSPCRAYWYADFLSCYLMYQYST